MNLKEVKSRSLKIRSLYHELEKQYHGSEWSVEEDALAFLTDAGLVGRLTMAHEDRWPDNNADMLESKIGECVWWLAVLAERMNLNFDDCVEKFLKNKQTEMEED